MTTVNAKQPLEPLLTELMSRLTLPKQTWLARRLNTSSCSWLISNRNCTLPWKQIEKGSFVKQKPTLKVLNDEWMKSECWLAGGFTVCSESREMGMFRMLKDSRKFDRCQLPVRHDLHLPPEGHSVTLTVAVWSCRSQNAITFHPEFHWVNGETEWKYSKSWK